MNTAGTNETTTVTSEDGTEIASSAPADQSKLVEAFVASALLLGE
jgi:hypothetical protein